jgi:hypothetical protein
MRRRSRRHLLAWGLVAVPSLAVAQDLETLLGRLGPASPAPEGSVATLAWVERTDEGFELVVSLEAEGGARLVADPGIAVSPIEAPDTAWSVAGPVERVAPGKDYFERPQSLRLPFRGEPRSVSARVEYAWCLTDYQCLFGERTVTAELAGGG